MWGGGAFTKKWTYVQSDTGSGTYREDDAKICLLSWCTERAGSKEFENSYSSSCHFALVLQLDKEGLSTCPDQVFPSKDERTSGFFGL